MCVDSNPTLMSNVMISLTSISTSIPAKYHLSKGLIKATVTTFFSLESPRHSSPGFSLPSSSFIPALHMLFLDFSSSEWSPACQGHPSLPVQVSGSTAQGITCFCSHTCTPLHKHMTPLQQLLHISPTHLCPGLIYTRLSSFSLGLLTNYF